MLYRPSNAAIGKVALLAGALLAILLLATFSQNTVFAQGAPGAFQYAENGMEPVVTYTATDPEGADIVWSLAGVDEGDFTIDGGALAFKSSPNYEMATGGGPTGTSNTYLVTVRAGDGGDMTITDQMVTVTVTNVEEPGTITLSSLQPQAGVSLTATLADPDTTDGDPVSGTTWTWESASRSSGPWTEIEGAATMAYRPENADAGRYLRVTAEYTDPEGSDKSADAVSANAVRAGTDVGNEAPEFQDAEGMAITVDITREVPENTAAGEPVGDPVVATDENDGDILTYTLGGTNAASFSVDVETGQLRTKAALDVEAVDEYSVTVTAKDPFYTAATVNDTSDTIMVNITVTGVDEDPTVSGAAAIAHPENGTVLDTSVSTYTATDPENETPTWSLSGTDMDKLEIHPDDGLLAFTAAPDFENPGDAGGDNVYEITVVATDTAGNTGTQDVTVKVTNVEEDGTVSLSSVQPRVGVEITASVSDLDGDVSGGTWQWSRAAAQGNNVCPVADTANEPIASPWTAIDDADSAGYTSVMADNEMCLQATATYTDGEDSGKITHGVSVHPVVPDTQNKAPMFPDTDDEIDGIQNDPIDRSVAENTKSTDDDPNVGAAVVATDPNSGDNLTYTLGGTDVALFRVGQDSGQITVAAGTQLDKETKGTYTVEVTATDSYGLSATTVVNIKVTGVDEAPKISGEAPEEYPENGMEPVATYTATDPEGADIVWSLAGVDEGDFTIDGGALAFKSSPNYEMATGGGPTGTSNTYLVTVRAGDGGDMTITDQMVTVTVTNVEEPGTITLSSLQPQAGVSLTATLADPDTTDGDPVSGTTWTWESASRSSGPWTEIEGAATMAYRPENADAGRYLRVTAEYTDPEGSDKSADAVSANAVRAGTAEGNEAPEFQDAEGMAITVDITREVPENTAAGEPMGDPVVATDENDGDILTYTLGGTNAASFSVDVETGQLRTKAALDVEAVDEYSVTVTAKDPFYTAATVNDTSDTIMVNITVTGVDEDPTVSGAAAIAHPENGTVLDTSVSTYTATDPENETPTWSLSGTDMDKLEIHPDDGLLAFTAAPGLREPWRRRRGQRIRDHGGGHGHRWQHRHPGCDRQGHQRGRRRDGKPVVGSAEGWRGNNGQRQRP